MKKHLFIVFLILSSLFFSGCATLLNTTTQEVEIKSNPPGARITIDNKKYGTTPQVVNLERKKDHTVKIEMDGYQVYETQITTKISFWFWGNIVNGLIPGMVIDMFTGSMNSLLPDSFEARLDIQEVKKADVKK